SRPVISSALVHQKHFTQTCGSSPPQTQIWRTKLQPSVFGRTCYFSLTQFKSNCHPYAIDERTSCRSRTTYFAKPRTGIGKRLAVSMRARASDCYSIGFLETFENWITSWSVPC